MPEQLSPENKFSYTKKDPVYGVYYIIDNESGMRVGINGKVFRAKNIHTLSEMMFKLKEAYRYKMNMGK
jgi:hypothetical protein